MASQGLALQARRASPPRSSPRAQGGDHPPQHGGQTPTGSPVTLGPDVRPDPDTSEGGRGSRAPGVQSQPRCKPGKQQGEPPRDTALGPGQRGDSADTRVSAQTPLHSGGRLALQGESSRRGLGSWGSSASLEVGAGACKLEVWGARPSGAGLRSWGARCDSKPCPSRPLSPRGGSRPAEGLTPAPGSRSYTGFRAPPVRCGAPHDLAPQRACVCLPLRGQAARAAAPGARAPAPQPHQRGGAGTDGPHPSSHSPGGISSPSCSGVAHFLPSCHTAWTKQVTEVKGCDPAGP